MQERALGSAEYTGAARTVVPAKPMGNIQAKQKQTAKSNGNIRFFIIRIPFLENLFKYV
jgi:hypothetical protein